MVRSLLARARFSLRSLLILILGIAIGLSLNLKSWRRHLGLAANESYMTTLPTYTIAPPDTVKISVTSDAPDSPPALSGTYLVGPDGAINLGQFGQVLLNGLTVTEARSLIAETVAPMYGETAAVDLDVASYNSRFYYIVTEGPGTGDTITRVPITGHETVFDALAQPGVPRLKSSAATVWVARPSLNGGPGRVLSVDMHEILRGDTATNYQVLPGDRVFITQKSALGWLTGGK